MNKTVVNYGDVSVSITYKTPRTELRYKSLEQKYTRFYKEVSIELGEDENAVFYLLMQWGEASSIVESVTGELDFVFPVSADDIEATKAKFMQYLYTRYAGLIDAILRASRELEAPMKAHLAPNVIVTDAKKKQSEKAS